MPGLRQRQPAHRNRKLLDVAHEAPCFIGLSRTCGNHASVPAHSDSLSHGRGVGQKSHDCLAVSCCPDCHVMFTRERLGIAGYELLWARAFAEYQVWLWTNGKLRVA